MKCRDQSGKASRCTGHLIRQTLCKGQSVLPLAGPVAFLADLMLLSTSFTPGPESQNHCICLQSSSLNKGGLRGASSFESKPGSVEKKKSQVGGLGEGAWPCPL